jgi:hypothetical protein
MKYMNGNNNDIGKPSKWKKDIKELETTLYNTKKCT